MRKIVLNLKEIKPIRTINPYLVSYNIEMTEITGGTFWKAYTPEQISGKEKFKVAIDFTNPTTANELMQYFPPIDLSNVKLRALAKALGKSWIRVSGTWATKTYYDFEGTTGGKPPKGYDSVLTKEQWIGVLEFVKAMESKLLISVSNCEGDHPNGGPLDLTQARKIFEFSEKYGVPIDAVEFMNEPNMLSLSGSPKDYTGADYARDQDILNRWIKKNYPNCLTVGPCNTDKKSLHFDRIDTNSEIVKSIKLCSADELLQDTKLNLDIYSYHYYNGGSERLSPVMPHLHWGADKAHTDEYLEVSSNIAKHNAKLRDKYVPNGQMWVTESGDAFGGGNTWGSTYLDVIRTLNELGSFPKISDGVIFHNTLASSDYGFLEHGTFNPRPNYFAALLWNTLMGDTVYETNTKLKEGKIYCHSYKKDSNKYVFLIINNSLTEDLEIELPKDAIRYTLGGNNDIRNKTMFLNDKPLTLKEDNSLPMLDGKVEKRGFLTLSPCTCTFLVI